MSINRVLLSAACSVSALAFAAPAVGQTDDAAQTDEQVTMGTVTVTATRRDTDIQEVPIAVTTVSSEQIDRAGVIDVRNLDAVSSSFTTSTSQQSSTVVFRIRGIGTAGNNSGFESAVGVFLDGVYLSRPSQAISNLVDVEQIEILRGPQGTLFGRNTSAGALSISTKKPDTSEFGGFANASFGNFNFASLQGALNIPLVEDSMGLRFTGSMQQRDPFLKSSQPGSDSNDLGQYSLRGQFLWEGHEDLSIRVITDYTNVDEVCCSSVIRSETPLAQPGLVPGFAGSAFEFVGLGQSGGVTFSGESAFDDRRINSGPFPGENEQFGLSAEVNWDLGFGQLTYIPAYRKFDSLTDNDVDYTERDVFSVRQTIDIESTTHELRLQGTAFNDRLDWLVGGFYSDESIGQTALFAAGPDYLQYLGANLVGNPMIGTNLGPNPLLLFTNGVDASGNTEHNIYNQDSESFSLFSHNIISLTDNLELTLGARYVDESKDGGFRRGVGTSVADSACASLIGNPIFGDPNFAALRPLTQALVCFPYFTPADLPGSGAGGVLPTPATYQTSFSDEELVYTAKLGYAFNENVNGYASYTYGFKSGGINLDATAAVLGADPRFDSETVDAFELGLKSTLFDGRARANLALFHMDIEDFQLLEFTGINFQTYNVPKAQSTGFELELDANLTDSFSLKTAVTYADTNYPDDCDAGLDPAPARVTNLCGEQLTNAPELTGILGATYETVITDSGWSMFATGSLRHESDRRTASQPGGQFDVQPSNTKYDARLGFVSPDKGLSIELWGLNLSDERTWATSSSTPLRGLGPIAAQNIRPQDPRTYGVTVRRNF